MLNDSEHCTMKISGQEISQNFPTRFFTCEHHQVRFRHEKIRPSIMLTITAWALHQNSMRLESAHAPRASFYLLGWCYVKFIERKQQNFIRLEALMRTFLAVLSKRRKREREKLFIHAMRGRNENHSFKMNLCQSIKLKTASQLVHVAGRFVWERKAKEKFKVSCN